MANYTTAARVAALTKIPEADIVADWLEDADAAIEARLGGGFKGAARTLDFAGDGSRLFRLPSVAENITSIIDMDGETVSPDTYSLSADGRTLRRTGSSYVYLPDYGAYRGYVPEWERGIVYTIDYTEPATPPAQVVRAATAITAEIAMFAKKYGIHGVATTSTKSGSAGSGSQSSTVSYPENLSEEINKILAAVFRNAGLSVA